MNENETVQLLIEVLKNSKEDQTDGPHTFAVYLTKREVEFLLGRLGVLHD